MRLLWFALVPLTLSGAEYRAGVASTVITPEEPLYLSGYAARTHASEGKVHDLKAKALAIQDGKGARALIITTDVIGLPRWLAEMAAVRIQKEYGIPRSNLLLNSSHTHTGPYIAHNLDVMFELKPEERAAVDRYSQKLAAALVAVAGAALQDLAPARLWFGNGQAHFAINRREATEKGVKIGLNPSGPTDPDVPVLKVTTPDGRMRALLFGYACHNTTLTGEFYKFSGDYAGFAQLAVEAANPGATAMFMELCGADQNPNPRSSLEHAEKHGQELAAEVQKVASGKLAPVGGAIRAAFQTVDLAFAYHTRDQFQSRLEDQNVWRVRNAKAMLRTYDEGHPIRGYSYPVQAIAFGKDLTMVALGGEVVVDYCLRLKREYGAKGLVVAGYSNDVMAYIPSARVLKEGGYEVDDSMIYYGMPCRWADDVEERIFGTLHKVMRQVKR